ncbi:MAG: hypothetical protein ACFFDJ_09500, partial [Candidatus Odinarchaeota archaeon]
MSERQILANRQAINWKTEEPGIHCLGVYIGKGSNALEIVLVKCDHKPTKAQMLAVWKERKVRRPNPILLVAEYDSRIGVCGLSGETPPIYF